SRSDGHSLHLDCSGDLHPHVLLLQRLQSRPRLAYLRLGLPRLGFLGHSLPLGRLLCAVLLGRLCLRPRPCHAQRGWHGGGGCLTTFPAPASGRWWPWCSSSSSAAG